MKKMVEIYSKGNEYYYILDGKERGGFSTKEKAKADAKEMNRARKAGGQEKFVSGKMQNVRTGPIQQGATKLTDRKRELKKSEWFSILKKNPRRAKKARKKRKKKKRSPYTNPKLRAKVVAEAKAKVFGDGQGGNASGKWSGRKAQWAAREYKKRGGGYR